MIRAMDEPRPEDRTRQIFFHWYTSQRYDRAIEAGLEALAYNPQDAAVHSALGVSYMATGDEAKAREHYRQSLAIEPQDARTRALLSLTELRRRMPRYARAEKGALDALAHDPNDFDAWHTLAWTTMHYDEDFAMQCSDRLLALQPDNPWAHLLRGQFLASFEGERVDEGKASVERALSLAPDDAGIQHGAAEFFVLWGKDKERARAHLQSALVIDPNERAAIALKNRLRLERHPVARLLLLPIVICGKILDFLVGWSDMKIWWISWPLALLIGIFTLWLAVIWAVTLFPLLKLFEWLFISASELRWHPKLRQVAGLLGAPEPVRWLAFVAISAAYLGSIWLLRSGEEGGIFMHVLGFIVPTVLIGLIVWVCWKDIWGWWRKRVLHKRLKSMPAESG